MAGHVASMWRNLRDIRDWHLRLLVTVRRYDPATGQPLNTPVVEAVHPDRAPAGCTPNAEGAWWEPLAAAGLIELPAAGVEPQQYMVTAAGEGVIAAGPAALAQLLEGQ